MSFTSTKWWYLNLLVVFASHLGVAQVVQSGRFEIPIAGDDAKFEIVPAEQNGLFLFRRLAATDVSDQVEIIKLDTAFQESWHGYLPIDRKFLLVGHRAENKRLYLLLRYMDYTQNDMELISLDQQTGIYDRYFIKNFIPFSPNDFQVTPQAAIIGGYFNRVPVVIYYSFLTGKSRIAPGLLNESGELTQIKTYPDGAFDVLISAKNHLAVKTIWIKNYSADGELVSSFGLEPEDNKNLIFARSLKTNNDVQVVAGVYGGRNSDYSKGLFMASIDRSGAQQLKYYNFADLENFFKYMKAKKEQRVKERIHRRKIRGKKIRFNYRFLVHELVPYNNQYILLGEAFYPHYIALDRGYFSGFFSGPMITPGSMIRDGRIFDGYYYTHAVVMGFDPNGRLLWDNSFEINDVKTYTLEQFVKLEAQPDRIALLYLYQNELRSKIIKGSEVLEGKTSEPIKTKLKNETARTALAEVTRLDYWYNKYFYAYGVQDIFNPELGKRRVFFINKITYN